MHGEVRDSGLRLADGRELAWEQVYYVDWTARDARLATALGVVTVSRADGDLAERRVAPWEAEREAWAAGEADERWRAWAGATEGERAVLRQGWLAIFQVFACAVMALGMLLFVTIGPFWMRILGLLALPPAAAAWVIWRRDIGPNIAASAEGLCFGGLRPHRVLWSDARAAEHRRAGTVEKPDATHLVLLTHQGRAVIKDHYRGGDVLRAGVRQAIADRQAAAPAEPESALFAPSISDPGQGLRLDSQGLAIVGEDSVERVGWGQLPAPLWTARGASLPLSERRLELRHYVGGDALAQALDNRLHGEEAVTDAGGGVRAEVIERWLGVPPGGSLLGRVSPRLLWGWGLAAVSTILLFCWIAAHVEDPPNLGQFVAWPVVVFVVLWLSARTVVADADGLSVRRGKRRVTCAWSDVVSLRERPRHWEVRTESELIRLSSMAQGVDRVIGTLRRVMAMREQGLTLPTSAPLPEAALSPARDPGDGEAERGLSVSAEE